MRWKLIIILILQLRKLNSEKINNLLKVTQQVSGGPVMYPSLTQRHVEDGGCQVRGPLTGGEGCLSNLQSKEGQDQVASPVWGAVEDDSEV